MMTAALPRFELAVAHARGRDLRRRHDRPRRGWRIPLTEEYLKEAYCRDHSLGDLQQPKRSLNMRNGLVAMNFPAIIGRCSGTSQRAHAPACMAVARDSRIGGDENPGTCRTGLPARILQMELNWKRQLVIQCAPDSRSGRIVIFALLC